MFRYMHPHPVIVHEMARTKLASYIIAEHLTHFHLPPLPAQPWERMNALRVLLLIFMLSILTFLACVVTTYCYISFVVLAFMCIPLLDTSATIASFAPCTDCFRQKDLLFLENYKCARLPLQAILQSLPEAILMVYILASEGPSAPVPLLSLSLALALLNVLGNAASFISQAAQQYGGRRMTVAGLKHLAADALSLQGASQVPRPVMERSLHRMLRSASDFVINEALGREEEEPPAAAGGGPPDSPAASHTRSDAGSGSVPLVPHFVIPCQSGMLVPGQVATLVQEAFSR